MGIHQLMNLIKEKAPKCFRQLQLEFFSGRKGPSVAMLRWPWFQDNVIMELMDKEGNRTGHLVGLFNRTLQFLENGIKPVWVFDGKPPKLKNGELAKRKKAKQEAKDKTEEALEEGKMDIALMQNQRNVHITGKMKDDAVKLLKLMGCPVIEAPCEAEAQCAELCKGGKIYATATEDMDALTFATPILLRGFNTKKEPIYEINFQQLIDELHLTYPQFVDLCILCGCDYTDKIEGIGPATAYKLISEYQTIEAIIEMIEKENHNAKKEKYKIPQDFRFIDSRELFVNALVTKTEDLTEELKWQKPNEEELKKFLIEEKGFSLARVESGLKRINKKDLTGYQPRIENFFTKSQKISSSVQKDDKKKKDQKKTQSAAGGKKKVSK